MLGSRAAVRGQSGARAPRAGWPVVARALHRTLMGRRGAHHLRLRCAAVGIAPNTGQNAAAAVRGGGRCPYASAQPPCLAGCADGNSLEAAAACRGLRTVSQWRALLALPAALAGTVSRTAVGGNRQYRGALHFQAR